jgi:hypothetical protein
MPHLVPLCSGESFHRSPPSRQVSSKVMQRPPELTAVMGGALLELPTDDLMDFGIGVGVADDGLGIETFLVELAEFAAWEQKGSRVSPVPSRVNSEPGQPLSHPSRAARVRRRRRVDIASRG